MIKFSKQPLKVEANMLSLTGEKQVALTPLLSMDLGKLVSADVPFMEDAFYGEGEFSLYHPVICVSSLRKAGSAFS